MNAILPNGNSVSRSFLDQPELTLDDPWGIYYTGGTTGLPKGAVLTHGNMTWNSVNTITSWGINGQHKAALQLPFFHIGGPNIFMVPMVHAGGTTILCSGFDPDETFDLLEHAGITHYVAVPTMFQMLQEHPRWEDADFSKLELVISGGAPCPLPIMQKFWDRGVDFKMGYGLTEASGNNFWLPPELVQKKIGSVGYPIFHIDMKIIDDNGSNCETGKPGELLIRGPHIVLRVTGKTPRPPQIPSVTAGCIPVTPLFVTRMAAIRFSGGRKRCLSPAGRMSIQPKSSPCYWLTHSSMKQPWSVCHMKPGAKSAGPLLW